MGVSLFPEHNGSGVVFEDVTLPNKCPLCHHAIRANILNSSITPPVGLEIWLSCPNCERTFIAQYAISDVGWENDFGNVYEAEFLQSTPVAPEPVDVPSSISEVSESFGEIYAQALNAESFGLYQLVGIGLRKSLEFLIKDYSIKKYPTLEVEIRRKRLGECIQLYINDERIKNLLKRAVWLGNDETHYERKWTDRDVEDMKKLIRLSINYIDSEIISDSYVESMKSE